MKDELPVHGITAGRVRLNPDVLKARRHHLGMSQEAFAVACFERQLCVSIASVKRAETGKSLLLRTARHLAAFHDMPLDELLVGAADAASAAPEEAAADGMAPAEAGDMPGSPSAGGATVAMAHDSEDLDADLAEAAQVEGRLVQVLCVWPVAGQERDAVQEALRGDGATLMAVPAQDAVLAVFGLPRAQRQDVARCLMAAKRYADRHVFLGGGRWLEGSLDWPQEPMNSWVRRQGPGVHVHRSMFGQVRAWHQIDVGGHADLGRLGPAHQQVRRPFTLAGRQHEMRLFGNLLNAVLADQQCQVLLVQGMAGMGKSRLLAEMQDVAQRHFMCAVQADIQDFGGDRHRQVFVALLKSLLDLGEVTPFWDQLVQQRMACFDLSEAQALLCKDLLALRLQADERLVLQAMGHAARGQALVQLFSRVLARMALQRPMLVVIEDVHWASASTLETLARIMAASQESQLLWVLSGRVEAPQQFVNLQRMLPDLSVTTLNLAPLRGPEAEALAWQFREVDEAWRHQCMQQAQGHPLFLTQLLMAERQASLPDNFQHLLQVRLDELSPQDRHAMRLSSVLGQRFSKAEVRALMQSPEYELDTLVQHCLLRQLDGECYDFLHALIRQGIYEGLHARQRDAMHAQVAAYFDLLDHALAAQHLHLARQPQAPQALLAAARERHALFDHEAALSLLQMYEGIDYAPRDEYALAMALGEVHAKMGQMPQARQAYEAALRHAPDEVPALVAKVALAGVLNVLEDLDAEERLIDEAIPQAQAAGALAQLAAMHYLKGNLYFPRGDVARSRSHHAQAMALAQRAGEARLQAQALSGLGDSYYAEGLMSTANGHFVRCLQLCDAHGLRDIEASNRFMLATTQIYLNQTAQALAHAEASAELGRRVGNRRAEIVSRLTASWVHLGAGRATDALAHVNEGLMISRAIGAMRFEPFLQEAQARALFVLGDEAQAQRTIQSALDGVEMQQLHTFIGPWVMGTWALLHHQDERVWAVLARAEEVLARGCVAHNVYRFHASAMEVYTLAGRAELARETGERWLQRTGREPTPWVSTLHAFMAQCQRSEDLPHPGHPVWQPLRQHQNLHVLLHLPRRLLR